jgi:hypothetical protein
MTSRPVLTLAAMLLLPLACAAEDDPLASERAIVELEHQRAALITAWEKERADLERLAAARALSNQAAAVRLIELAKQRESRHLQEQSLLASAAGLAKDEALARKVIGDLAAAWRAAAPALAASTAIKDGLPAIEQLHEAAMAFDRFKAAAARWEVEIGEGRLPDGSRVGVQLLDAGLCAAWFLRLDGQGAGQALRDGAGWSLIPSQDPAVIPAVTAAIAQFRGNSVPQPVLLPAPEAVR